MTVEASPFHAGERAAQSLSGRDPPRVAPIRDHMPDQHRAFFSLLPFLALATEQDGWPVPSILTGPAGFIASPDPRRLTIAGSAHPEDPIAALLRPGARIGALGLDLATRRRNRANGRVLAADQQGLTVEILESFGNCPKYIQARDVEAVPTPSAPAPLERLAALDDAALDLLQSSDCLFVASFAEAGVDISHRGGRPGFVRVDRDRLGIPDFAGNRYYNTLGNLLLNPKTALLFIDFDRGDLLCLQGLAAIDWRPDQSIAPAGAERTWSLDVENVWRRRAALPLRWRFREFAPSTETTGIWG